MENLIELEKIDQMHTIEVKKNLFMWMMPFVIAKTYQNILAYFNKQNISPSKEPFIRYFDIDWQSLREESKLMMFLKFFVRRWSLSIGFVVDQKVDSEGIFQSDVIKEGRYVKAIHKGAYQKVSTTYNSMLDWLQKENLQVKDESIEFYLNDPKVTKTKDLTTKILIPLGK